MPSEHQNDDWLKEYYSRLQSESQFSSTRRDNATNWGLTVFLGVIATYAALLTSQTSLPSIWRILLLLAALALEMRFFVQSMIAYSFLRRWRYLEQKIESHWSTGKPTLAEIVTDVQTYDHGRRATVSKRDMVWSQVRAGFLLVFLALAALLLRDVSKLSEMSLKIWGVFIGLAIYFMWEIYSFLTYDQLKKPSKLS